MDESLTQALVVGIDHYDAPKEEVRDLAGAGPVTLRLSVQDSGDSLFDTAVLLDAIEVR